MLPKAFTMSGSPFTGSSLRTPEQRPRWQRGWPGEWAAGQCGGRVLQNGWFPPEAKASRRQWWRTSSRRSERIDALSWMKSATKAEAKAELATRMSGSGIRSVIDYSAYEVKPDDAFGICGGAAFSFIPGYARLARRSHGLRRCRATDRLSARRSQNQSQTRAGAEHIGVLRSSSGEVSPSSG